MKLLRLRVEQARVIIVASHCRSGRLGRLDEVVLRRDFGAMIAGFHEVDSLVDDRKARRRWG